MSHCRRCNRDFIQVSCPECGWYPPRKSRCDACGAAYNGCPLHKAAPALVAALKAVLNGGIDASLTWEQVMDQAKAALALAKSEAIAGAILRVEEGE